MSRAEAEPAPDRNASEPSIDDVLAMHWEQMQGMFHPMVESGPPDLLQFVQGSATINAGGYGVRPGRGLRGARRALAPPALTQRPQTGHIVLFPVDPPSAPPPPVGLMDGPGIPPEVMQAALEEGLDEARTVDQLMAMQALPFDAIQALMNVPDVPLPQWHLIRERAAQRGRRPSHARQTEPLMRAR